jgi:cell wall assembly regulator SMI1
MSMADEERRERLQKGVADIKEWMLDHGAEAIVANLLDGASDAELDATEQRLGARLPSALRELYKLHAGQRDREANPFFEGLVFADLEYARLLRQGMLYAYFGVGGSEIDRQAIFTEERSPLTEAELNAAWFPLGNIQGDFLAVHLQTERVYWAVKDFPALRLAAPTLTDFICAYADKLWDDQYEPYAHARSVSLRLRR